MSLVLLSLLPYTCMYAEGVMSITPDDPLLFVEEEIDANMIMLSSDQADSVMSIIGRQKDVMLYCGFEKEAETYMVLCDYWKALIHDSVNTDSCVMLKEYFEVWVLGFDLHTGDTLCTPIDPSCIWFHQDDSTYNVGAYLFADLSVKPLPFKWRVPKYTLIHCLEYAEMEDLEPTYHYEVHNYGYFASNTYKPLPPPHYRAMKSVQSTQTQRPRSSSLKPQKIILPAKYHGSLSDDNNSSVRGNDDNKVIPSLQNKKGNKIIDKKKNQEGARKIQPEDLQRKKQAEQREKEQAEARKIQPEDLQRKKQEEQREKEQAELRVRQQEEQQRQQEEQQRQQEQFRRRQQEEQQEKEQAELRVRQQEEQQWQQEELRRRQQEEQQRQQEELRRRQQEEQQRRQEELRRRQQEEQQRQQAELRRRQQEEQQRQQAELRRRQQEEQKKQEEFRKRQLEEQKKKPQVKSIGNNTQKLKK